MIRFADLRSLDTEAARRALEELGRPEAGRESGAQGDEAPGACLTAWQAAALRSGGGALPPGVEIAVTVPDFLNYARLLNTGQALSMIRLPGSLVRSALAGMAAAPGLLRHPVRAARTDFWLVAQVLLRYDLALLPPRFGGTVLLHSYLADFAFLFERRDFVTGFFRRAGAARAGVHTQQLPLALSCLARWGVEPGWCSFLYSEADGNDRAALESARRSKPFAACRFVAETESLPPDLQYRELFGRMASPPAGYLTAAFPTG